MININLVIKPPPLVRWSRVLLGLVLGTALMGSAYWLVFWRNNYQEVLGDKAQLEALQGEYTRALASAKQVSASEAEAQKQQTWLAQVGRNQGNSSQANLLRAVLLSAPTDVAVTELSVSKEHEVTITGQAANFDAAMRYLRTLQVLPVFSGVQERKLSSSAVPPTTFTFVATVVQEVKR